MPMVGKKKYSYTKAGKAAAKKAARGMGKAAGKVKKVAKKAAVGATAATAKRRSSTRKNQRSRAPYQETDTGPGLMTATGSKTRKKKPSVKRKK